MSDEDQKPIEAKLRRSFGLSSGRIEDLHRLNATVPVWVRCWNCKSYNEGIEADLRECEHCHKNLWSRE